MANARKSQTVLAVRLRGFCSVPFIFDVVSLARLGSPTPATQTRGHVAEPREQAGKKKARVTAPGIGTNHARLPPLGSYINASVCRGAVAPCSNLDAVRC